MRAGDRLVSPIAAAVSAPTSTPAPATVPTPMGPPAVDFFSPRLTTGNPFVALGSVLLSPGCANMHRSASTGHSTPGVTATIAMGVPLAPPLLPGPPIARVQSQRVGGGAGLWDEPLARLHSQGLGGMGWHSSGDDASLTGPL